MPVRIPAARHFTLLLMFLLLVRASFSLAQTKYEREYRIPAEEVPVPARACVDSLFPGEKVRWYFEENLQGNSVEAKLKYTGHKHSVEFDTLGHLQDIEIRIPWKEIATPVQEQMQTHLQAQFSSFKIRKIQRQYAGKNAVSLFQQGSHEATNYEVVVKGKNQEGVKLYEITFDAGGNILQKAEILFRNTDNLEY